MGYCAVADVLSPFPRFQQSLPNNVTSTSIQLWIDIGKSEIRARFLRRNLDPDNPASLGFSPPLAALTTDQANVLKKFNMAYAIARFGEAIFSQMNEGELKLVTRAREEWESMSHDTDAANLKGRAASAHILGNDGAYDALFTPTAAHVQVAPMFGGWAGADYDPKIVNDQSQGTFHLFEKSMKF